MKIRACLVVSVLVAVSAKSSSEPAAIAPNVIENSLGMKFVPIPAGQFLMGSDESREALARAYPQYDRDRLLKLGDEAPVHTVRITKPFLIGQHEVTVGQFRTFLQASGYKPESEVDGTGGYGYNADYDPAKTVRGDAFEGRDLKYSWRHSGFAQGDDHPVLNVTYRDAVAMARWLSDKEGKRYHLPTEAQWEYVCRAGGRTRYGKGDDPLALLNSANTFDAEAAKNWPRWQQYALAGHDGFAFTAPVGSFEPNAFGVYDMLGNAWEWVADWYDEHYYANSPVDATRKVRPTVSFAFGAAAHGTPGRSTRAARSATGIRRNRAIRCWVCDSCARSTPVSSKLAACRRIATCRSASMA